MTGEKAWYQSKTVWGGLVAVGAAVAGAFGIDLGAEAQGQIVQNVTALAGAVGGIVAVIGRVTAKDTIKKKS